MVLKMETNGLPMLKPNENENGNGNENGNENVYVKKITGVLPCGDTAGLRTIKKKDKLFCFHKNDAVKHDGTWFFGTFDVIFADYFDGYPDFVFRIRLKGIKDG